MEFNFESVFNDMSKAFIAGLAGEGDHIMSAGQDILGQSKGRVGELSLMLISGTIDKEHFDLHMEDIKMTMENQLLELEASIKSSAQKAINGAIDVLTAALSKILKLPI
jgi:hypothetical protein